MNSWNKIWLRDLKVKGRKGENAQGKEIKNCLYTPQNINLTYPKSDTLPNIHKVRLYFLKFVSL